MKKQRSITLIIVSLLLFASCSKEYSSSSAAITNDSDVRTIDSTTNDTPSDSTTPTTGDTVTATPIPTSTPTPIPTSTPTPTPIPEHNSYEISWSEGFYEDRAWVVLAPRSMQDVMALIDTDGKILYKTDSEFLHDELGIGSNSQYGYTPMSNGYTVLYNLGIDSKTSTWERDFLIINKDDEVTYSSNDGDERTHYAIIAQFGDKMLIRREESSFSEETIVLQLINYNGDVIIDNVDLGMEEELLTEYITIGDGVEAQYVGDGIYLVGDKVIRDSALNDVFVFKRLAFNSNTNSFVDMRKLQFDSMCPDGEIILTCFGTEELDPHFGDYIVLNTDELSEQSKLDEAINNEEKWVLENNRYSWFGVRNGTKATFNEGVYYADRGYRDIRYNLIVPLTDVPDAVESIAPSPFVNGRAFLAMKGVDGYWYYSHIDKEGKFLYEPKELNTNFYIIPGYVLLGDSLPYSPNQVIMPDGSVVPFEGDVLREIIKMVIIDNSGNRVFSLLKSNGEYIQSAYEEVPSVSDSQEPSTEQTQPSDNAESQSLTEEKINTVLTNEGYSLYLEQQIDDNLKYINFVNEQYSSSYAFNIYDSEENAKASFEDTVLLYSSLYGDAEVSDDGNRMSFIELGVSNEACRVFLRTGNIVIDGQAKSFEEIDAILEKLGV